MQFSRFGAIRRFENIVVTHKEVKIRNIINDKEKLGPTEHRKTQ